MDDNLPEDILKVLENLQNSDQVIVLDESNIISDLAHTSTNPGIDTSQFVEIVTTEATSENNQINPQQNPQNESKIFSPENTKKKTPRKKRIRNKNPTPRVWKPPPSKASNAQIVPISTLFQTEQTETADTENLENAENSPSDITSGLDELPDIESSEAKRRSLRNADKLAESDTSNLVKTSERIESNDSASTSTTTEPVTMATSNEPSAANKEASLVVSTEVSSFKPAVSTSPETKPRSIPGVASTKPSNDSSTAALDNAGSSVVPTTGGSNLVTSEIPSTSNLTSVASSSSSVSSIKSTPPATPKTANPQLMEKYKKVLTPEIMKNILNFQSPINSSGPCIYKLPDGTQLKVNFGTLKKQKKKRTSLPAPKPKTVVSDTPEADATKLNEATLKTSSSVTKAPKSVSDSAKATAAQETKNVSEDTAIPKPPEKFNESYLRVFRDEEVAANNNPNRQFNKYEIARAKKRIRQKLHPLPKGTICPNEPDRGEMVAIYRNKEEFLNLVVKCSECNCYHCPLCSQDGTMNVYRPAKFLNKMFIRHLMIKHWDTRVSLIHNETEYMTLCCRLHHAGTSKKHLHCPCGRVFIRSDLHRRFRVHRKTVCPLTKHFHPVKPKCVVKKCPPCCTINPVPEDQHRSIFDSYEEFMREASAKCSSCDKYHCLVCSVTLYNPQKQWVLNRHLKRHYQSRVTLPGREAPFFIGCRQKHSDIRRKHFHCLCGQIVKSVAKTFVIHMKKCPYVLNPTGNRDNYTHMTMIRPSNLAMSFIKPIQVRAMIPRNSMPIYSRIGEKIPPPPLAMSIFDSLEELCSVIKRCYTCCTQYHCPLCSDSVYQPSSRRMLAKHLLKVHYKQKIKLPSGQHSFPCYLPHQDRKKPVEPKHHHCVCGYVQVKKKRFLSHTRSCKHSQTRILNPAVERLHDYLVPETQLHNNFGNLQQYPHTGNYNQVEEVYEVSSSEEEEAPKKIKEVPEPEPEEDPNKTVDMDHNMYCQKVDHWEETLEEHLKAKSMMTSIEVPEDDFDDTGDVQFGPFEGDDDDVEILEKKKDRAFYHDIVNTYQSDPIMGIFNPFDMLVSQLIQCTDCCDLYHCPWCPPEIFVPNNYRNTSKHLRKHWSHRVLMIDGTFSLPCYHDHGLVLSKHYHCMCSEVVQAAPHVFYRHVKSCPYMVNLVEECRLGNQEVNAPMPAREVLYQTQNKSKLDKVVDQLEIHIKSPQKSSTQSSSTKTSQKKQKSNRSKCKRKYEKKKKAKEDSSEDENVAAAQSIMYESQDLVIAEDGQSIRKRRRKNTEEGGKGDYMTVYEFEEQSQIKNNGGAFVQTQHSESQVATQNIIINALGDEVFQQGCTYDIVIPPDGLIDINSIQHMLPSGSSYVIVDK